MDANPMPKHSDDWEIRCGQLEDRVAELEAAAKPVVDYYDNRGVGIGALSERIERLKAALTTSEENH